jgi:hypothetical protein
MPLPTPPLPICSRAAPLVALGSLPLSSAWNDPHISVAATDADGCSAGDADDVLTRRRCARRSAAWVSPHPWRRISTAHAAAAERSSPRAQEISTAPPLPGGEEEAAAAAAEVEEEDATKSQISSSCGPIFGGGCPSAAGSLHLT